MITRSGIYRVTVNEANNPTYISGGVYRVTIQGETEHGMFYRRAQADFRSCDGRNLMAHEGQQFWSGQKGTFETIGLLNVFESQQRVVCMPIAESLLDALANSLHGKAWKDLTDIEQIKACKVGL